MAFCAVCTGLANGHPHKKQKKNKKDDSLPSLDAMLADGALGSTEQQSSSDLNTGSAGPQEAALHLLQSLLQVSNVQKAASYLLLSIPAIIYKSLPHISNLAPKLDTVKAESSAACQTHHSSCAIHQLWSQSSRHVCKPLHSAFCSGNQLELRQTQISTLYLKPLSGAWTCCVQGLLAVLYALMLHAIHSFMLQVFQHCLLGTY